MNLNTIAISYVLKNYLLIFDYSLLLNLQIEDMNEKSLTNQIKFNDKFLYKEHKLI